MTYDYRPLPATTNQQSGELSPFQPNDEEEKPVRVSAIQRYAMRVEEGDEYGLPVEQILIEKRVDLSEIAKSKMLSTYYGAKPILGQYVGEVVQVLGATIIRHDEYEGKPASKGEPPATKPAYWYMAMKIGEVKPVPLVVKDHAGKDTTVLVARNVVIKVSAYMVCVFLLNHCRKDRWFDFEHPFKALVVGSQAEGYALQVIDESDIIEGR
jgi:hypothetical protein